MAVVYLGLGSNIGRRSDNLEMAIQKLDEQPEVEVVKRSSIIETLPYGKTDQPDFLNMCLMIKTRVSPLELLELIHIIEHDMGRVREEVWGPRTIDIDILLYEDLELELDELTIPHIELHKRDFVLNPLSEIAADVVHPTFGKTIGTLKKELEAGGHNV